MLSFAKKVIEFDGSELFFDFAILELPLICSTTLGGVPISRSKDAAPFVFLDLYVAVPPCFLALSPKLFDPGCPCIFQLIKLGFFRDFLLSI